jgi:hypothetical protein
MSKSLGNFLTVRDALKLADKNVWRLVFLRRIRARRSITRPSAEGGAKFVGASGKCAAGLGYEYSYGSEPRKVMRQSLSAERDEQRCRSNETRALFSRNSIARFRRT